MRIVVTGGRKFDDITRTFSVLDQIHSHRPVTLLIHGGATGLDTLAEAWAVSRKIPRLAFPVSSEEWERVGKMAGHLRNQSMIDKGCPDLGVAFPGNRGTADMKRRIRKANIPLIEIGEKHAS